MTRNLDNVDGFLNDLNTWYLADTLLSSPDGAKGTTILVSSPSEKHYSEFLKCSHVVPLHYLPIWSLDELKLMAPSYKRSEDVVEKRFDMIGGLPRYVLEKDDDLEEVINLSIEKLDLKRLLSIAIGEVSKENQISHRVVHFEVKPPVYTKRILTMASVYALNKASAKFLTLSDGDLKYFIFLSTGMPSLAFFRAKVFEDYGHRKLSEGGSFSVRSLEDGKEETLELPRRSLETFQDLSKCKNSNVYYKPPNSNFPCIDSVIPGLGYFQMTTSLDHPIKKPKMREIVSVMHVRKFYFVVPDQNFRDFQKQIFEKDEEKAKNKDKEKDQTDEITIQISEMGIFEEVENLDENIMEENKQNDSTWNPRKDLMHQYNMCLVFR